MFKSRFLGVVFAILMAAVAVWFWLHWVGNPVHEFALIKNGKTVPGSIVETEEDAESGDEGGTHWFHSATYTYQLSDGRAFTARTHGSGQLKNEFRDLKQPYPIEVEYLADSPQISRIKGDGSQSVSEWLWKNVCLSGLLLALFLSPAYLQLRSVLRDRKKP